MWCITHGEKGRQVSIRYNADSNLQLIIKVLRFKRLAVAVNSNGLTEQSCLLSCATGRKWGIVCLRAVCACVSAFAKKQR